MEVAYLPRPRSHHLVMVPVALLAILAAWCTMRMFDARGTPDRTMSELTVAIADRNLPDAERAAVVEAIRMQVLEGICALCGAGKPAAHAMQQIREAVR